MTATELAVQLDGWRRELATSREKLREAIRAEIRAEILLGDADAGYEARRELDMLQVRGREAEDRWRVALLMVHETERAHASASINERRAK